MATSSISGLVSGLDTATIVDQLISVESASQRRLQTRLTSQQTALKALQDLNSRLSDLRTQAEALVKPTAWQPLSATTSSTSVVATATTGSSTGSFEVRVLQTAATHRLTFSSTAAGTDHVTGDGTDVTLTVGGVTKTLATNGTMAGLVSALNASGTGVRASSVRLDDGTQRLVVESATSGVSGGFTLTAADGSELLGGASVRAGQDAAIAIGPDTVHSSTNTFSGTLTGLSLTVSAAAVGTTVTVDVAQDTSKIRTQVRALVDAVNQAVGSMDTLTSRGSNGKGAGIASGDPVVRALRGSLLETVFPGDGSTLATYGLQTDRYGKLVFDADAFDAAYASDPSGVATALGTGFADRIAAATKTASDPFGGTLTSAINGRSTAIRQLQDSISDWDDRLELRRTTLTRQFTALETALGQMNSQSSWLASQISQLSSNS